MLRQTLIMLIEIALILSIILIFARIAIINARIYNATTGRQALERFLKTNIAKNIKRYSYVVEYIAAKYDAQLPQKVGLDIYWSEKLFKNPKSNSLMKKVLRYATPEGLYSAFYAGLVNKKNEALFKQHIDHSSKEKILRDTALMTNGRDFPSAKALAMFVDYLDVLRKMTKSNNWEHRFFAYKILLQNTQNKEDLALCKNAFTDPDVKLRNLIIKEHLFTEDYYSTIYDRLINDPILKVRINAKNRIAQDYKDFYKPEYSKLEKFQKIRFIGELNFDFVLDKQIAYQIIREDDDELSFPTCRAMEANKELKAIFLNITKNDKEDYNSKLFILKKAASFNCTSFLKELKLSENIGTLYAAADILREYGKQQYISDLAFKVFSNIEKDINNPDYKNLYIETVKTIAKRGNEMALKIYRNEIIENQNNTQILEILLKNIPKKEDLVFFDTLLALFKDKNFKLAVTLFDKMQEMPEHRVIPAMFDILRDASIRTEIKTKAISLLFTNNKDYYMQDIIENINLVPFEERVNIANTFLKANPGKSEKIFTNILKQNDSSLTPSLLQSLANTEFKDKIKTLIPDLLSNQVAQIRQAACYCANLLYTKDQNNLLKPLLRDPIKYVRETATLYYAQNANDAEMQTMLDSIEDANEFLSIKESAIKGLANSNNAKAFEAIIKLTDFSQEIHPVIFDILKTTYDIDKLKVVIKHYNEANKISRNLIEDVFVFHEGQNPELILELLDENLKEDEKLGLNKILYKSGYIEKRIFDLQNMSRDDRREAVTILSKIKEYHSARGLVYAAFDTDKKVSEIAIEAMKSFSKENKDISTLLLSDSNRIVRKQASLFYKKYKI